MIKSKEIDTSRGNQDISWLTQVLCGREFVEWSWFRRFIDICVMLHTFRLALRMYLIMTKPTFVSMKWCEELNTMILIWTFSYRFNEWVVVVLFHFPLILSDTIETPHSIRIMIDLFQFTLMNNLVLKPELDGYFHSIWFLTDSSSI